MPTPAALKAPFVFDKYYHIVFKSIDGLLLFNESAAYDLFLNRFAMFTTGLLEIWAYILLQNHVHFIVKIKPGTTIETYIKNLPVEHQTKAMQKFLLNINEENLLDAVIERQCNSFMVSYVNTVNNKKNKQGGFFQKPFKRVCIDDDVHLQQAIIYVHANAQKHCLINDFKKYRYSSYEDILKGESYSVNSSAVIDFFGGKDKFIKTHDDQVGFYYANNWPSSKIEV